MEDIVINSPLSRDIATAEAGYLVSREQGTRRGSHYYHANNGYYYHKYRQLSDTIYLRCTNVSCPSRGLLKLGSFHESSSHSGHEPDHLKAEVLRERSRLLGQASSLTFATVEDVLNDESNINRRYSDRLTPKVLLPAMRTARINAYPEEPKTLSELQIILECENNKSLTAVSQFRDNIYGGSARGEDGSKSILFITKRCVDFIKTAPFIYAFSFPLNQSLVSCSV
ncbi:uncharacterized protein LOC117647861 [Thrips palmi]|uniref:Uncharacterized protein LOC117647861 n=1 Tax=Thrips palmi TaxID=161013 RepID=A0A6P8YZW8_THRPL|nr:uncharacterized protein LOC117647861 [Thrips palmi]